MRLQYLNVRVEKIDIERLETLALASGSSKSGLVRKAIKEYLKNYKEKFREEMESLIEKVDESFGP